MTETPALITHHMGNGLLSPCGLEPASVYFGFQGGFTSEWSGVDCPDCLANAPEGVGAPTPQLQKFYVTFGVQYSYEKHPYWDGADPAGWLTVLAPDEEAARLRVRMFIGLKWSMMYDSSRFDEAENQRTYYPKGELARIAVDGPSTGLDGVPTRRFGTSSPEYYGRNSDEVVAVRIEGVLKHGGDRDAIEKLGYEVEYYHPHCWIEGVQAFREVHEMDRAVQAGELDWANPHECPVCETSIT